MNFCKVNNFNISNKTNCVLNNFAIYSYKSFTKKLNRLHLLIHTYTVKINKKQFYIYFRCNVRISNHFLLFFFR